MKNCLMYFLKNAIQYSKYNKKRVVKCLRLSQITLSAT